MTNQVTIDKLLEMRLTTMADAFRNQVSDFLLPIQERRMVRTAWWGCLSSCRCNSGSYCT